MAIAGGENLETQKEWHLDRKVTLGLIAALLANAGGSIWWAARVDSAVMQHEQKITAITVSVQSLSEQQNNISENLARIQEGQKYQIEMLRELRDEIKVEK